MNLWLTLLTKDLRRAVRNPLPWLIHLAVPLALTALLGLAFGRGTGEGAALGRIRFAVVDEEDSPLTRLLRGALNQGEAARHLEPEFLDRTDALAQLHDNQLSAVVILPPHFTRDYLAGRGPVTLELIKNPARSIHPAVLEELLGVGVTGLNALARTLGSEFPAWRAAFEQGADYRQVADLIRSTGEKLDTLRRYLDPPRITYRRETPPAPESPAPAARPGGGHNLFGYLLAGLATMFLLFQANTGMEDLQREFARHTFARYHTLHHRLLPFLAGKGAFVGVMLLVGAGILFGGGGLLFGIAWKHPLDLAALVAGFLVFAVGLAALLAALIADARRADALGTLIAMALGMAGGCAFPPESLPAFLREHITPLLPTAWLAQGIRELEFGSEPVHGPLLALRLAAVGMVLLGLAAAGFRRRFARGLRP